MNNKLDMAEGRKDDLKNKPEEIIQDATQKGKDKKVKMIKSMVDIFFKIPEK